MNIDTSRIYLIGFSYTGKSTTAKVVSQRLGWKTLDLDDMVAKEAGKPVAEIFATQGEQAFREMEKELLGSAATQKNVVIATGGGTPADPKNMKLMLETGIVIGLEARAESIHARMQEAAARNPGRQVRPLLAAADPLLAIRDLKATRQPFYAQAHWTVHTDSLDRHGVAQEILRGYQMMQKGSGHAHRAGSPDFLVTTETQSYPGYVGWGLLDSTGSKMRALGLSGSVFVIADLAVQALYGAKLDQSLAAAGFQTKTFALSPGESSKSLNTASRIYSWLSQNRAERKDIILSVGGGMACDLAGFVAATYLRGMPLVHVPTSLLAMVDASIGGKVAVNLPTGKNLVGAFYQPSLVLADTETLSTLPRREVTAGWAEVVKHALILDRDLFMFLEKHHPKLLAMEPDLTAEAVRRSAAIKADVVSQDEKETNGLRMLLNYGHTVGHALEAATDYSGLLHGEAVGIGMMAAGLISHRVGLLSRRDLDAQRSALSAFDLPLVAPAVDWDVVKQAMMLDKKVSGKAIQWVLLQGIGRSTIKSDVPPAVVEEALESVRGAV